MAEEELTQQELASRVGVSQPTISRYLEGEGPRTGAARRRLERFLEGGKAVNEYSKTKIPKPLLAAVRSVWNGTEIHAQAIGDILSAFRRYDAAMREAQSDE